MDNEVWGKELRMQTRCTEIQLYANACIAVQKTCSSSQNRSHKSTKCIRQIYIVLKYSDVRTKTELCINKLEWKISFDDMEYISLI